MEDSMGKAPGLQASSQDPRVSGKESASADNGSAKRRCVSMACIACRRRKSKCDGNLPSCAACSSVYHTPCVYDPNSDHRRKGAYKKDSSSVRSTKNTTLQTIVQAIMNSSEDEAFELVRHMRSRDNLEEIADSITDEQRELATTASGVKSGVVEDDAQVDQFESELADKFNDVVLDGSRKFIGGTSNLIFLPSGSELRETSPVSNLGDEATRYNYRVSHWTNVTDDEHLISHLMTMYFTWHYPFFVTLSRDLFYRDYIQGISSQYCSSLLVNAMLALGCHFSRCEGAYADPLNCASGGDHFFKEAKKLALENDEYENARLCTVQALALMSVREAGCGREGKGWTYSGMSFRMALDLGLNLNVSSNGQQSFTEEEVDARRITFWGCYLFDKCWSNYLGRQPQLSRSNSSVPMIDILPNEEAGLWSPYTDAGARQENTQPSRTRAVAYHIFKLSEISSDLLMSFYLPTSPERPAPKQVELKKLSEIHARLEAWKKALPRELEPKEGQLPQALVMHMFYHLLLIHLYRPFLKYTKSASPLPQHVSPRLLCTQAASSISKLLRVYKRAYNLSQICNIAVYIAHTACTIHLLNLPEKNAEKDLIHGLLNLEEIAESWLCARRTLRILDISANKWQIAMPPEATGVFERTEGKWGVWGSWDQATSPSTNSDEYQHESTSHRGQTSSPSGQPQAGDLHTTHVQQNITSTPNTAVPATSMTPQFQPEAIPAPAHAPTRVTAQALAPAPAPASGLSPTHGSVSHQLQRLDSSVLPEPTYLKPVPNTYQPVQAIPFTQHDAWDNTTTTTPHRNTNNSPSATTSPFSNTPNLVEESQDWWSRNPNAMGFGMDDMVDGGWGTGIPGASSSPTSAAGHGALQQPSSSEQIGFPIGMPQSGTAELEQNMDSIVYNHMGYPGGFPP